MKELSLWEQIIDQFGMRWQDLLSETLTHIQLVSVSMIIAICIALPLGILITRVESIASVVLGMAGMLQTNPSIALLGFMIPLFGVGMKSAIIALFLYSLLPILRNTYTGIKDVDPAITEAARGMGMTSWQILIKVELPIFIAVIMAGVRTSAVINVGTATLAAFIGVGGLGSFIFLGMTRGIDALVLLGAVPAALLAIILEFLLTVLERRSTSKGLR